MASFISSFSFFYPAFTSRFPGLLRSGTLVFKSSKYREWFSERIQPWIDYIPVNYNLSDLIDKVAWAESHPQQVEQIAEHSRQTVERLLSPNEMRCYTYRLMLEYQALFDDDQEDENIIK